MLKKYSSNAKIKIAIIVFTTIAMAIGMAATMFHVEKTLRDEDFKWAFPMVSALFFIFFMGFVIVSGLLTELLLSAINKREFSRDKFTLASLIFLGIGFAATMKVIVGVLFFGERI